MSMTAQNPRPPFFEELDFQQTPIGDLALRRRRVAALDDAEVYEVTLGGGFLMSSLFTVVEIALADLALAGREGPLDVVVGGLGLGYTAQAALRYPAVRTLVVVEALEPVIGWHQRGLDPQTQGSRWHAILLDIDHSPRNLLDEGNAGFYRAEGLQSLANQLHPGGIFAMWSDDPADEVFLAALREVFGSARAETVRFPNPLLGCESSSTVYLAELN
jgi:spermidine synthase